MAIVTGSKDAIGAEFVQGGIDATGWSRLEPVITPDQLKRRHLFGIPLISALPHPITQKRDELTQDDLKDIIVRAVAQVEFEVGISILPTQKVKKLPFDRSEYLSLGFFQLPDRPILQVNKLEVWSADNTPGDGKALYTVPNEWVDPGHFQHGQVSLLPLTAGFIGSSSVPSQSAGGAFFLSILGTRGWIPSYWACTYTTGFGEGRVPIVVNELIGTVAAMDALEMLQATNRIAGFSVGLDAASQSIQTAGPQVYQTRIEALMAKKQVLVGKVKAFYSLKLFSSTL